MSAPPAIEQISISLTLERKAVTPATSASARRFEKDHERLISDILSKSDLPWIPGFPQRLSPFQICLHRPFGDRIHNLHKLLRKALIDIVERWFSDIEAKFPNRMPLEPHEEELLQWMYGPGCQHVRSPREVHGIWRTDFLIEKADDGAERAKICEINARLPYNGTWIVGRSSDTTQLLSNYSEEIPTASNFKDTRKAVFNLFDKTRPLCHIREQWPSVDSKFVMNEWASDSGSKAFEIKPSQLRSRKDSSSATGRSLYCVPEDSMDEMNGTTEVHQGKASKQDTDSASYDTITQCSVELFQEELRVIDADTLHQLATCCTNDFRESLLIHDKRLLCILREELPNLVKRGVLTEDEREILRDSTIETIIPGSPAMSNLFERSKNDNDFKKDYIIKPVRDGNGVGVTLGKNVSQSEWLETIERLASRPLRPNEDACIVQHLINHEWYDIATHYDGKTEVQKCHVVGSYHMIGSELGSFGPWRVGKDINLKVEAGGCVMCAVLRPDGWPADPIGKEEE